MPLVLPLVDGRVVVVLVPVRPLVPAVGRLPLIVGLDVVDGRVVVLLGRLAVALPDMLLVAVGRVAVAAPLIKPELGRPETLVPLCMVVLPRLPPLIEPAVLLLPCLTLAT